MALHLFFCVKTREQFKLLEMLMNTTTNAFLIRLRQNIVFAIYSNMVCCNIGNREISYSNTAVQR